MTNSEESTVEMSNSSQSPELPVTIVLSSHADLTVNQLTQAKAPDSEEGKKPKMTVVSAEKQLTVTFERLSGTVPAIAVPPSMLVRMKGWLGNLRDQQRATPAPKKQVLFEVTGEAKPGEVLALMGPSGSGKTTLLSTLAGRSPSSLKLTGSILYNGKPLTKSVKRRMGYVLQDDLLYESLTVLETLSYSARLRLPKEMPYAEKIQRVEAVITDLGLSKCSNTIIGGGLRRGVSGGERKRVSVGTELLTDPAMLLLDEPTSGLDSTTAQSLLSLLTDLARNKRTIITTIHQPSCRMYDMLDKLLLLADGHIIYYGVAAGVVPYFARLGLELPYTMSVAEFILDLATGQIQAEDARQPDDKGKAAGKLSGTESIAALYLSYEQYSRDCLKGSLAGIAQGADLKDLSLVRLHIGSYTDRSEESTSALKGHSIDDEEEVVPVPTVALDVEAGMPDESSKTFESQSGGRFSRLFGQPRVGASYWEQLKVLYARSLKVKRFDALAIQKVFQFTLVALISGLYWWQRGQNLTIQNANDLLGLLFFMSIYPAMNALTSALFSFPLDYNMLLKERASGMYRVSAFYFARTFSDLPVDAMLPTVFVTILYYMGGLRFSGAYYIPTLLSIHLLALVAVSLGLMLGAIFMNPKTAIAVATTVIISAMLLGGFFVRDVPGWISWLKYLSYIYWGYNLVLKIQLGGLTILDCPTDGTECTPVTDVQSALNLMVNPNDSVWPEIVVLFGMLVFIRCVIYVVLRYKTLQKTRSIGA